MSVNFIADVLGARPPSDNALIELTREGHRREWTFAGLIDRSARFAGMLASHGVGRGDVVMSCIGNRSEWVLTMLACFRIGAVALPCNEQLRVGDLTYRLGVARPSVIVSDERNLEPLRAAEPECVVLVIPDESLFSDAAPAPLVDLELLDPALITFTSGSTGHPKAVVHGQRYLFGQRLQAESWFSASPGEIAWCTAASGWSKSARNAFIAPWLCGATALLHDARFDPQERVEILAREHVNVLCMAPTEYRVMAKRTRLPALPDLRRLIAAGEALDSASLAMWKELTGLEIRDGYGQTETGQLTGLASKDVRAGSMGQPLPGIAAWIEDGELVVDPETVPTFFLGYLGEQAPVGSWRTGDLVRADDDGYLYFEGRADDLIISAGYRISPAEVESTLRSHPAVADAAVVSAPDEERGMIVRAVVVTSDTHERSDALAKELQEHVKRETAPYKYPRIIEWADALPRTPTGKIKRAELRR
jgi:acetyl-CoA synthetase